MILTTTPVIEGKPVKQYLGIIGAQNVAGINVFKDMFAKISNVVGGRSDTLQQIMNRMRQQGLDELKEVAAMRGANAVISVRLDFDEYAEHMLMLNITGTAVIV